MVVVCGASGAVDCSRALPAVRKVHAAPKTSVRPESTTRSSTPLGNTGPAKRSCSVSSGLGGGNEFVESTRRTRSSIGKGYDGGGSRRRSLDDDEEGEEVEEEECFEGDEGDCVLVGGV